MAITLNQVIFSQIVYLLHISCVLSSWKGVDDIAWLKCMKSLGKVPVLAGYKIHLDHDLSSLDDDVISWKYDILSSVCMTVLPDSIQCFWEWRVLSGPSLSSWLWLPAPTTTRCIWWSTWRAFVASIAARRKVRDIKHSISFDALVKRLFWI